MICNLRASLAVPAAASMAASTPCLP